MANRGTNKLKASKCNSTDLQCKIKYCYQYKLTHPKIALHFSRAKATMNSKYECKVILTDTFQSWTTVQIAQCWS